MSGKEYIELKEALLSLNLMSTPKGYNYTLQSTYRYSELTKCLLTTNWLYKWKNNGHKYEEMLKINNIVEGIQYISKEMQNYVDKN